MLNKEKILYDLWKLQKRNRYLKPICWNTLKPILVNNNVSSVLEFGCGLSTLLFDSLGLKVTSYETDQKYIYFVDRYCSPNVELLLWDNSGDPVTSQYDLSLVDGILPRTPQLKVAVKHSDIVAIDDFKGRLGPILMPELEDFERIGTREAKIAVFARRN